MAKGRPLRLLELHQRAVEILGMGKKHRLAMGLTQEELALQAELDRTFLSLMERGLRRPSLTTIFILSRQFGLTPAQLVQEVDERLRA